MKEAIVVGGGQAGLAVSYWLVQNGIEHTVLDAHEHVGDCWRLRWDSLELFTPAKYNGLSGMAFPGTDWSLPGKDEAADYLAAYAKRFDLPIRTGAKVSKVVKTANGFEVFVGAEKLSARQIVIATGAYGTPRIPVLGAEIPSEVAQMHTSAYRRPSSVAGKRILVVGAGASGQQLARELAVDGRNVWLAGPEMSNLPRNFLGKDIYWWLYRSGLITARRDGVKGRWLYKQSLKGKGDVTVGECMESLQATGVKRMDRLVGWGNEGAEFKNGEVVEGLDAVLWATGYRNNYDWLEFPVADENGRVRQWKGVSENIPGLYFMGLPFMYRQNSSLLGGVAADGKMVAKALAARKK